MLTNSFEWEILDFFDKFKCDFLNAFFQYISEIFGIIFLILILMLVYWCFSKEKGKMIAYNAFSVMCLNGLLKGFINRKRPFEVEGKEYLRKLTLEQDGATGSSFPSGHTMNSAGVYGSVVYFYHEKKHILLDVLLIFITFLVGISRIYLGVHFFTDVFFGILYAFILIMVLSRIQTLFKNKIILLYLITLFVFLPFCFIKSFGRTYMKCYGMLFGFVLAVILEEKYVNFNTNTSNKNKIIRILIGGAIVGGTYLVYVLVPGIVHNNYIFTFVMHSLVVFNGFFFAPFIFKKIEK